MSMRFVPLAIVFSLTGCSTNASLSEFESYKEQTCACKDSACAEALTEKYKGLQQKLEKMTGSDKEKATNLVMEAFGCTVELASDHIDTKMKEADEDFDLLMLDAKKNQAEVEAELKAAAEAIEADLKKLQEELGQ